MLINVKVVLALSIFIFLEGGVNTLEECEKKTALLLLKSNQFYNEIYSAVLIAQSRQSEIASWVDGCDSKFKRPIINRLDLLLRINI